MHSPYTTNFADAFETAELSTGLMLSAVLWHQRRRPLASRVVLQLAVAVAAAAPWLPDMGIALGKHMSPDDLLTALRYSALLATLGVALGFRVGPLLVAVVGEVGLHWLCGYVLASDHELAAAHLAWVGLLVGLHREPAPDGATTRAAIHAVDATPRSDWIAAAVAFVVAALVGAVVLQHTIGSSDEWAYTYQASVFAKLHAYANEPACSPAFQSFWVFPYMGKLFSQYTPGWPYFMVPFVWLGVPWLAGPASFALFVLGVARVGRRTMAMAVDATPREVHVAGVWASAAAIASSTLLINGGSRFPHVLELACFVWAIEALFRVGGARRDPRERLWAVVLGVCCALLLAIRPVDGAGLGVGLFVVYVYALLRGRISLVSIAYTAASFVALSALTLVILHAQLGKWFTTGYSLAPMIHAWAKYKIAKPKPQEWRYPFPLATGSYGWFPCTLALGFAGLASLGKRARALNVILVLGLGPVLAFYAMLDLARGYDWGYGPRYQMVLMVPMILGTGVVLARLHRSGARWALPAIVAVAVLGVVRLAPLVYPFNYMMVQNENRVQFAVEKADLHHAIVLAPPGTGAIDPHDIPQNLPLDLYPDQDVLYAVPKTAAQDVCVRRLYADRLVVRANGSQVIHLTQEP